MLKKKNIGKVQNCCRLDFPVEVVHLHRLQCSKTKSWVVKRLKSYSISDNLQETNTHWVLFCPVQLCAAYLKSQCVSGVALDLFS